MAVISKMNINSTSYDLPGSSVMNYIAGEGISIDENGKISFTGSLDGVTPEQLEAIAQELRQQQAIFSQILDTTTLQVTDYATLLTRINEQDLPNIVATTASLRHDNEEIMSQLSLIPGQITSTVQGALNDPEWKETITGSVIEQTQDKIEIRFEELNKVTHDVQDVIRSVTVTPDDGVKIAAGAADTASNYTKITEAGMEIYVGGSVVAQATSERFTCINGFGIDDWIIARGNSAANLLFYRKGS